MSLLLNSITVNQRNNTVGLVHGAGFNMKSYNAGKGIELSPVSIANAERAADMWISWNSFNHVVVTGLGPLGKDYGVSEASLMNDILVARGVDEDMILKEDKSTSTIGNWAGSLALINDLDVDVNSIVAITSAQHTYRGRITAESLLKRPDTPDVEVRYVSSMGLRNVGKKAILAEGPALPLSMTFLNRPKTKKIPLTELDAAFVDHKRSLGVQALKRIHYR